LRTTLAGFKSARPGAIRWGLVAVAGAFLAWRILTLNLADQHAEELKDPAAALAWDAGHPAANLALGLAGAAKDPDAALARLQAAIDGNPGEGRAYAALGLLLENKGELARAQAAMETASRLAPQRSDVQMEVAAFWMRRGDFARALAHFDTVLRHNPAQRARVFPGLVELAADPARQAAFMTLLAKPVEWWPAFFIHAASKAPSVDTGRVLFNLQKGGPNAATPEMLRAWLARLQKEGLWLEAWFVWLDSLPKEQAARVGYLFNGSFETPLSNLGFDWINPKHPGVMLDTAGTYESSGDRALRVSFRGLRVQFQHLYQYLMLPPGDFHLQGRVRPDNLEAPQGMQWALYCVGRNEPIAVTDRFRGSTPWTRFRTPFSVPAEGCPVQMLRLELAGTVRLDFEANGTIWFDELRIEPVRAVAALP
jgi:tetratricopeptide (TPR) repeat protein